MILAIYGASGLGREIVDLAIFNNDNRWEEMIFVDDNTSLPETIKGIKVMTYDAFKNAYDVVSIEFIIGIGEPTIREVIYKKVKQDGYNFTTLIDKSARVSSTVNIGEGTIICEFATIHDNVEIGVNSLIQPMADIGHDIKVGNHVVVSPFCAPGGASVFGDRVYVGMHATILQGLKIGEDSIIGMGAVVYRDVEPGTTVIGNPARVTKGNDNHRVFS